MERVNVSLNIVEVFVAAEIQIVVFQVITTCNSKVPTIGRIMLPSSTALEAEHCNLLQNVDIQLPG